MPFAFVPGEPLSAAIPRLMLEQIERAAGHLTNAEETPEKRIHNARKRVKETRAVLRLVRDPLGRQFAAENRWYRDAARDLASARDAQAVIEALDKLPLPARTKKHAHKVLERRKAALDPGELQVQVDGTIAQLDAARARLGTWPSLDDAFDTVGRGLERTYRDGRRGLRFVQAAFTPHNLHEWRKRVKDLWYHLQLLRPVWPEMMKANTQALATLSELLGDHHDLHVLDAIAAEDPNPFGKQTAPLREAIAARLTELETAAVALGVRVYAEKPAAWHARIRAYWQEWVGSRQ